MTTRTNHRPGGTVTAQPLDLDRATPEHLRDDLDWEHTYVVFVTLLEGITDRGEEPQPELQYAMHRTLGHLPTGDDWAHVLHDARARLERFWASARVET